MREDTIEICHLKKRMENTLFFESYDGTEKRSSDLSDGSFRGWKDNPAADSGRPGAGGRRKNRGTGSLKKKYGFSGTAAGRRTDSCSQYPARGKAPHVWKRKRSSRHLVEEMEELGLSGCENQAVSELSGGMRQRVAVLRAMRMDADFLLWMSRSGDWMRGRKRKR